MNTDSSFHSLLQVLTAIRAAPAHHPLTARVKTVGEGHNRISEAYVHYRDRKWRLKDSNGSVFFDPSHGVQFEHVSGRESPGRDRDDWLPADIALFFPLQMRIWGGPMDDLTVIDAEAEGAAVRLSLNSPEDREYRASALVNLDFGVVTEFQRPPFLTLVEDLRPMIPDVASG